MTEGRYTGLFFHWIEEWSQLFQECNWYTFHPIDVEFENDSIMGGWEATVIFMGLGFRVRYNHTETETVSGIKDQVDEIVARESIDE